MRGLLAAIAVLFFAGTAAAQCPPANPDESTGGLAYTCRPYDADSIFNTELPAEIRDGTTTVLDYLYTNSQAIATDLNIGMFGRFKDDDGNLIDPETVQFDLNAVSGNGDGQFCSINYGTDTAADPWFKVTNCEFCANDNPIYDPATTAIRIPQNRNWSGSNGGGSDSWFCGISVDGSDVKLYSFFRGSSTAGDEPFTETASGCGSTAALACNLTIYVQNGNIFDFDQVQTYQQSSDGSALRTAALATAVTVDEVLNESFPHALGVVAECSEPDPAFPGKTKNLFPAWPQDGGRGDFPCDQDVRLISGFTMKTWTEWADNVHGNGDGFFRAPHGALFFLDYTDAQLATIQASVSATAYPFIEALTKYGAYEVDTNSCCPGYDFRHAPQTSQAEIESGIAPTDADLYVYYVAQGLGVGSGTGANPADWRFGESVLSQIPDLTGPNCPTTACSVFPDRVTGTGGHIHVAHECVSLWRGDQDYSSTPCSGFAAKGSSPTTITWTTQPTGTTEDTTMASFGVTLSDAASGVTCSLQLVGSGATISGSTSVTSNGSGVCSWTNISVSDPGSFQFKATAPTYTEADSVSFNITANPGGPGSGTVSVTDTFTIDTHTTQSDNQDLSVTVASGDTALVLCVVPDSGGLAGGSATLQTGGGLNMTKIATSDTVSGGEIVEMWYYVSPPVGTYNIRYSKGWGSQLLMGAYALSGSNTDNFVRDSDTTSSSGGQGTSASITLSTTSSDFVLSCWGVGRTADPVNVVEDEGTEAWDIEGTTDPSSFHNESHYYDANAASETPSITWTNSAHYGGVAAAIIPQTGVYFTSQLTGTTQKNGASGVTIAWDTALGGNCHISYSMDEGTTWVGLGSVTCATKSFTGIIPAGTVRLRIYQGPTAFVTTGNLTVTGESLGVQ